MTALAVAEAFTFKVHTASPPDCGDAVCRRARPKPRSFLTGDVHARHAQMDRYFWPWLYIRRGVKVNYTGPASASKSNPASPSQKAPMLPLFLLRSFVECITTGAKTSPAHFIRGTNE